MAKPCKNMCLRTRRGIGKESKEPDYDEDEDQLEEEQEEKIREITATSRFDNCQTSLHFSIILANNLTIDRYIRSAANPDS
jgi:hypothetical protein